MAFRIGQKVVCVNGTPRGIMLRGYSFPTKGTVYTVASVGKTHRGDPGITVVECPHPFLGWSADRFRPAAERKTSISIFKEILDRENHGLPSRVDYPADCEPK